MVLKNLLEPLRNLRAEQDPELDVADMSVGMSISTIVVMILALSLTLLVSYCNAIVDFNTATVQHTNESIVKHD